MTAQEAIKFMYYYTDEDRRKYYQADFVEAHEMAISALEKQIGKKPHKNYSRLSDVWCDCEWPLGRYNEGKNYCENCGQAICWDATEDEDGK